MSDGARTRQVQRVALAVAALAVLAFLPALRGEFVYDDHRFLAANTQLDSLDVLWRAFTDPAVQTADGTHAGLWRPLRTLLFAFERALFGIAAWGPHLVSLLLHGLCAFLLTHVFAALLRRPIAAGVGALISICHPAQAEAVAWVSSQGDLLAFALVLGSVLAALRDRERTCIVLGALALLSKEQAVVWPLLLVVVLVAAGADGSRSKRGFFLSAGVTAAFVTLRHVLLDEPLQEGGLGSGGPTLAEVLGMLGHQTAMTVLPVQPVFDWQMPWPPAWPGRVLLLAAATLPIAGLWSGRTRTASAWFLIALIPTLFVQLVVPLNIRVADRFLVFALPGLGLVVGGALDRRRALLAPAALVAGMLLALSLPAADRFRSDETLWSHAAQHAPAHWRAQAWLGATALREDRVRDAVEHLTTAADAAPGDAKTRFHLGLALEASARLAQEAGRAGEMETLFRGARDAYAAAANRYGAPGQRQENRTAFEPLARLHAIDLTLALGDRAGAERALTGWLRQTPPQVPELTRARWAARLESLAAQVAIHLNEDLAGRLREWGRQR